jgi:hypothetical protein
VIYVAAGGREMYSVSHFYKEARGLGYKKETVLCPNKDRAWFVRSKCTFIA